MYVNVVFDKLFNKSQQINPFHLNLTYTGANTNSFLIATIHTALQFYIKRKLIFMWCLRWILHVQICVLKVILQIHLYAIFFLIFCSIYYSHCLQVILVFSSSYSPSRSIFMSLQLLYVLTGLLVSFINDKRSRRFVYLLDWSIQR